MNHEDIIRSLVCILAIDGKLDHQEFQFLQKLQKRFGVSQETLKIAIGEARQGKGKVQLSENREESKRIFELLIQATLVDGKIDPKERYVLKAVAPKIGLSKADVERMLTAQPGPDEQRPQSPPIPVPKEEATMAASHDAGGPHSQICPKCGFRQEQEAESCQRCGIIFRKYRSQDAEDAEDSTIPTFSDSMEPDSASARLENLKQQSFLLQRLIGVAVITVVLIVPGFLKILHDGGKNKGVLLFGLFIVTIVVYGAAFFFNRLAGAANGHVLSKRYRRDYNRNRGFDRSSRSRGYRYFVRYEFEIAGRTYRSETSVSTFHYNRLAEGSSIRVRYLPILPYISWLELW